MKNSKFTPENTTLQAFSFKKGYNKVQRRDLPAIQKELMKALRINNRNSFYLRLNGKIEPKISEAEAIERIFLKFGITDIWGAE